MGKPDPPQVVTQRIINVVGANLTKRLCDFRMRIGALNAGYPVLSDWHPDIGDGWGEFPQIPFERNVIYRGDAATWSYSHHQAITKLGDTYVASWSNGVTHEDHPGQEPHYATSADCRTWSEPSVLVPTSSESGDVRLNGGLYGDEGQLCAYVIVAPGEKRETAEPGMVSFDHPVHVLDIYETTDLSNWTHHARVCDDIYLFEGPRRTSGGKLLCCGTDPQSQRARVLIWDDASRPTGNPRVVNIEPPEGIAPLQGTWYQTDDGRMWLYLRNGGVSTRLALTCTDDEGDTWSDVLLTDFPNTYSRARAGRLNDGRFYIVGNNYDMFLDRRRLLVAISDDGRTFDRQYTLIEGETTRRIPGRHKEDGFHYPNTMVDGDNLIVIYSVNKEDIEIGVADMAKVD